MMDGASGIVPAWLPEEPGMLGHSGVDPFEVEHQTEPEALLDIYGIQHEVASDCVLCGRSPEDRL